MVEALQCGSILSIPPYFSHLGIVSVHIAMGIHGGVSMDIPHFETQLISDTRSLNIGISPKDEGEMGCTVTIR